MAGDLTEEEMAQRVAEAAEHGCPNDRHGQIRLIAGYQAGLGIGVTLRALQIILERPDVMDQLRKSLD